MPRPLNAQAQQMVILLLTYFTKEHDNGGPLLPLSAIRDRVAAALNLNISTINKLAARINKGESLTGPKKVRPRQKPVVDIDSFDKDAIRNIIYQMYKNKVHITLTTLLSAVREREIFNGCRSSLRTILFNMGFQYRKDEPRRGLMELPNIVSKRITFLRQYMRIKQEGVRQFVFLDETWIFKNGATRSSWQDSNVRSVKKLSVGGARYIILHAGCDEGFIPNAELVFASKTKEGDYHGEMNQTNFLRWFEHQLLINLEKPSCIVMDNASYHSTQVNKAPTDSWKKADIQKWLQENGIDYDPMMLKIELITLVKQNKPKITYVADELSERYGHMVLRLPPYHCIFNPIEYVWGMAKTYYANHVGSNGTSVEKSLATWREALSTITPEKWANTIRHTERDIQSWWDREVGFELDDVSPLIIDLGNDEDDTSSED